MRINWKKKVSSQRHEVDNIIIFIPFEETEAICLKSYSLSGRDGIWTWEPVLELLLTGGPHGSYNSSWDAPRRWGGGCLPSCYLSGQQTEGS